MDFHLRSGTKGKPQVFYPNELGEVVYEDTVDMSGLDSLNLHGIGSTIDLAEGSRKLEDESKTVDNTYAANSERSHSIKLPPGSKVTKPKNSPAAGPSHGCKILGTTITAVVGKEGIFVASDGKITSGREDNKGEILSGCFPKITKITDYILASYSGNMSEGIALIDEVAGAVKKLSCKVDMKVVRRTFKKEMKKWKKVVRGEHRFPTTILVYGYTHGVALVYDVVSDTYLHNDKGVYGSGSGFAISKLYMEQAIADHKGSIRTDQYLDWLSRALALSALTDPDSGSNVSIAAVWRSKKKMKKQGDDCLRNEHMMHTLERDYDFFRVGMETLMLFVVSREMPYSLSNEEKFNQSVLSRIGEGVEAAHLISKGSSENGDTVIARVIVFKDVNARCSCPYQPGDEVLSWLTDDCDYEIFVPTRDRIAKLCLTLTSIHDDF